MTNLQNSTSCSISKKIDALNTNANSIKEEIYGLIPELSINATSTMIITIMEKKRSHELSIKRYEEIISKLLIHLENYEK